MKTSNRLQELRSRLPEKEVDAILISQPENRRYLSGFTGSAGYLLITGQKAILATDFRYIEQVKLESPDYEIFKITSKIEQWFSELIDGLGISRLGFEAADVTFALYHQLSDALKEKQSSLRLVPIEGLVESLRAVKEPEEIELITKAAQISDSALACIEDRIHAGVTEKEVSWEIERFMREHGSQTVPFDLIVASGPNAALPHAHPTERPINAREPVVIDIGARVEGYASDLTRTICIGKPDDRFKKIYDIVLGAQLAAIAMIKEGMTGDQADSLARTVIREAGYADAFGHGLGHGTGLATHELPRLGPNSNDVLCSNMVFTIEPGIYLPGWGGVRIEDLTVMQNGRVRVISKAKKT